MKTVIWVMLSLSMLADTNAWASTNQLPKVIPPGDYTEGLSNGTGLSIYGNSGNLFEAWNQTAVFTAPTPIKTDGSFEIPVSYVEGTDPCQTTEVACHHETIQIKGTLTESATSVTLNIEVKGKHYIFQAPREPDVKTFTGEVSKQGTVPRDCAALTPPTNSAAEADANNQAGIYCAALLLKPVQVSDFTFEANSCVWGGPQYQYPSDFVYATASFTCE